MREVGLELSQKLRDPNGEYRVDIIIALTHSRVPNVSVRAERNRAICQRGEGGREGRCHG